MLLSFFDGLAALIYITKAGTPEGLPAYAQNKAGKQKKCHLRNANDTVITLLNCFWLKPNLILIYVL